MTPRRVPIRLACPKGERWSEMAPEDGGRRCLRCDRHLIDLSELTAAQVEELRALARRGGAERVCAKVSLDVDGSPIHRRRAVRRLVQAAAGVVMSVSVAACDAAANEEHTSESATGNAVEMAPVPRADDQRAPTSEVVTDTPAEPTSADPTEPETIDPSPRPRPRPPREHDPIVGLIE